MISRRTPDRGDVYWIDPNPTSGREMRGRHRFVVITPQVVNTLGVVMTVPVTGGGKFSRETGMTVPIIGCHYKAEVNEFLVQLNDCWKRKILVIAATNLLENIDPAILRPGRFDRKIFIGPPDLEARVEILKLYVDDRPHEKIDWLKIAQGCEFYTSAEIENVVNAAASFALREQKRIAEKHLHQAMKENPPALSAEKLSKMRAKIGFS